MGHEEDPRYHKHLAALTNDFGFDYLSRHAEMAEATNAHPGVDPDTVYLLLSLINREEITSILEMGSGFSTTLFGSAGKPYFGIDQHCYWIENNRDYYQKYGVSPSQIVCTDAYEDENARNGWSTRFEPELPFTPDFVYCDGNTVMLPEYTDIYSSRVSGMAYYSEFLGDALILFDDSEEWLLDSQKEWLATIGREVAHVFDPTSRGHRTTSISLPDRYSHLLDVVLAAEL